VATAVAATPVIEQVEGARAASPKRTAAAAPALVRTAAVKRDRVVGATLPPGELVAPSYGLPPAEAAPSRAERLLRLPATATLSRGAADLGSLRFRAVPLLPDPLTEPAADPPADAPGAPPEPDSPAPAQEEPQPAEPADDDPAPEPGGGEPEPPRDPEPAPNDAAEEPKAEPEGETAGEPETELVPAESAEEVPPEPSAETPPEKNESNFPPLDRDDEAPAAAVEQVTLDASASGKAAPPPQEGTVTSGDQGLRPEPALRR
jgi:hypothetical protein